MSNIETYRRKQMRQKRYRYTVRFCRTINEYADVQVDADNRDEAEQLAWNMYERTGLDFECCDYANDDTEIYEIEEEEEYR